MSSKRAYAGNARLIEIGSTGIPFRILLNIDKVENLRFEEGHQQIQIPNDDGVAEILDPATQEVLVPAVPPTTRTETVSTGWNVIIQQGGQNANIGFPDMEQAMNCYNAIVKMIQGVGIPVVSLRPLAPPKPESPLVGPDGKAIADAVNAADLHPDLAGGPGAGVAPNDDNIDGDVDELTEEDFELTDEDIDLLENPDIDLGDEDPSEDPPVN